jgi:hypothetical protein
MARMMSSFRRALSQLRGERYEPPVQQELPLGVPEPKIRAVARPIGGRAESDLCDLLALRLERDGWEVFFEVPVRDARPDILAFRAGQSLAIEAKLEDAAAVVRQGLRISKLVDLPFIALPASTAGEAGLFLARHERERPGTPLPGLLSVSEGVRELRPPSSHPRKPIAIDQLRESAERYGADRGGVPSLDQTERNLEIWRLAAAGGDLQEIGEANGLSLAGVRGVIRRLDEWRRHLTACPAGGLGCRAPQGDLRDLFDLAHRHADAIARLPELLP